MDNRMEVRIIELEYENKQNIETISLLTKRIDKLEARPIMYQRQDYT